MRNGHEIAFPTMRSARALVLLLASLWLLAAGLAPDALARTAYVSGAAPVTAEPYVVPVDLAARSAGTQIALPGGGEGGSPRLAISPDGRTVWAPNTSRDEVVPIAVATNTVGTPVSLAAGTAPSAVAVTPSGSGVYVTGIANNSVTHIDAATGTVVATIPVGGFPTGIAITPDGTRAYVANNTDGTVTPIDLTTDTPLAAISVGANPDAVAITPDGRSAYVINQADNSVSVIDVATNTVLTTIAGLSGTLEGIAINPAGSKAFAVDDTGAATPIAIPANTAGPSFPVGNFLTDVAVTPNGATAFAVDDGNTPGLVPIDVATNSPGSAFAVGPNLDAIAIVPNQPPHAAFAFSPPAPSAGAKVTFNGAGSTDNDGSVARYDWDFGDGTAAANAGAVPGHVYSKPGTYQVALTTTDDEGCSTRIVFTGQTAFCNGSNVARATHPVTVGPSCIHIHAHGSSFVPEVRPGPVVPGVRVKLAVKSPAHLDVKSTLLYSRRGVSHTAKLGTLSVRVKHWRRVRMAIPASLRGALPLGTPVRVKLHIVATPTGQSGCAASTTKHTIHAHVVEVFPHAVQHGRATG